MTETLSLICLTWDEELVLKMAELRDPRFAIRVTESPKRLIEWANRSNDDDPIHGFMIDADTFLLDRMSGVQAILARLPRAVRLLLTDRAEFSLDTRVLSPETPCIVVRKAQELDVMLVHLHRMVFGEPGEETADAPRFGTSTEEIEGDLSEDTLGVARDEIDGARSQGQGAGGLTFDQLIHTERLATSGLLSKSIGHELNNINSVLMSSTSELRRHLSKADRRVLDIIEDLEWVSQNLTNYSNYLLQIGRPISRIVEMVDVQTAVHDILQMLSDVGKTKYVTVQPNFIDDAVYVRVSRHHLEQVLISLIANATDAVIKGHTGQRLINVEFEHHANNQRVAIRIRDTGGGIPEDVLGNLFDPFFTTKLPGLGTGLGLTVARHVVEHYGGVLTLDTTPGVGTEVCVEFPTELAAEVTSPAIEMAPAS